MAISRKYHNIYDARGFSNANFKLHVSRLDFMTTGLGYTVIALRCITDEPIANKIFFFIQRLGMVGIVDENNDEPTVQARQHNNNNNNQNNIINHSGNGIGSATVHAHKVPAQVSPFELGMYTLLAALCFAIVAFVISCVVYASKYKQNSLEMPTTTLMSKNRLCIFGRTILFSYSSQAWTLW